MEWCIILAIYLNKMSITNRLSWLRKAKKILGASKLFLKNIPLKLFFFSWIYLQKCYSIKHTVI